jgi:hypothetical protein
MIPIDRWVQYYQNLLTENQPEYEGMKMDGEIIEVKRQ